MKNRSLFFLFISFMMILIFSTLTYAYFLYVKEGNEQVIKVETIVLSVNDNVDVNHINSKNVRLEKPGDYYEFQVKVANVGITAYLYEMVFNISENDELPRAIELHLKQDGEYQFVCMLSDIADYENDYNNILSGSEYDIYYFKFVYSAGAGEYYQGQEFTLQIDVIATMILEEDLISQYGIYYITSLASLKSTIKSLNETPVTFTTPVLRLLSNVTLDADLEIKQKISLDFNNKKIDLNGHDIIFDYGDTSTPLKAKFYDSLSRFSGKTSSADVLVDTAAEKGKVKISVENGFMEIDKLFADSSLIEITNYDYDAMIDYIKELISIEEKKNLSTKLDISKNIEYYIVKELVVYNLSTEMKKYITVDNVYNFKINQTPYTNLKEIDFTIVCTDSSATNNKSESINNRFVVVLGTGAQSLADNAINNIPDTIDSSLFLKVYDPAYNAYYTWLTDNLNLIDGNGVYLRNGYEIFDHYGYENVTIRVMVEQNGMTSYAEKIVKVNILNAIYCTELINPNIYDTIILDKEGDKYDVLGNNINNTSLLEKTQLLSVSYNIDYTNNTDIFDSSIKFIGMVNNQIVLLNKPVNQASVSMPVTITFVYEHGTYVVKNEIIVIGYAQTVEKLNVFNALNQYIPKEDVYKDFEIASSIDNKYQIKYLDDAVPAIYKDYFSIQEIDGKMMVVFKKPNLPNKITEVYFVCYVNDERFEINFKITGLIHNDIDDIPDEKLYLYIINNFDTDKDGWLTVHELGVTKTTAININSQAIKNIKGIEFLTGCVNINLSTNAIVDLTPLSTMYQLTTLNLSTNQIADVSPLANLDNLETLNLTSNIIYSFEPIKYLTGIKTLYLSSNLIQDYSPLEYMTSLTTLYIVRSTSDTFILSPSNRYYYALLYNNNDSISIYIQSTSTKYIPSSDELIAAKILSGIKEISSIYDVMNLITEYKYKDATETTTYGIAWTSSDELILKIINREYHIYNQIGETDIFLYATVTGFASGTSTINRLIKVSVKALEDPAYFIETPDGEFISLEKAIPDTILRNILFNTFNTDNDGDFIINGTTIPGKYVLSQDDLNPTNLISLDLNSRGIMDLTGLNYFVNCIQNLDVRNNNLDNPNNAFNEINALVYLKNLYVNNARFDYSILASLENLETFYVYGSFGLMDEKVLTGLFMVYTNNEGIKIYKDSNTVIWNPWLIPLQRTLLNLPSIICLSKLNQKYVIAANNQLRVEAYDTYILVPIVCAYSSLYNTIDVSSFLNVGGTDASITLTKCFPYTTSFYISMANTNAKSYDLTFTYYIEVRLEYNDELMYKADDGSFIPLNEAFPNRSLRYQIIDNCTIQTDDDTGYLFVDSNSLQYITSVSVEGGTDVMGEDGMHLSPIKGLELLTNLTTVTLLRMTNLAYDDVELYMAYTGSKITSLTIKYTTMSTACLDSLNNQLKIMIFDACKYISVENSISSFSKLEKLQVTTCNIYIMSFLSAFNEKFNGLEEGEKPNINLNTLYLYGNTVALTYQSNIDRFISLYNNIRKTFPDRELDFRFYDANTKQTDEIDDDDEELLVIRQESWLTLKNAITGIEPFIKKNGSNNYIAYDSLVYQKADGSITQQHMLKAGDKVYLPKYVYAMRTATSSDADSSYVNDKNVKYEIQYFYESSAANAGNRTTQQSIFVEDDTYVALFDLSNMGVVEINDEEYYVVDITATPLIDIAISIVAVIGYNLELDYALSSTNVLKFRYMFIHGGSLAYTENETNNTYFQKVPTLTAMNKYIIKTVSIDNTVTFGNAVVTGNYTVNANLYAYDYYTIANIKEKTLMYNVLANVTYNSVGNIFGSYSYTDVEASKASTGIGSIASISLNTKGLTDISGIQMFTSATSVSLYSNFIADITPLEKMPQITTLTIYNNSISDISSIKKLINLVTVNLSQNAIDTIIDTSQSDLTTVFKNCLNTLTSLNLSYNYGIDIDSLIALKNDCNDNSIVLLNTLNLGFTNISASITGIYIMRDLVDILVTEKGMSSTSLNFALSTNGGTATAGENLLTKLDYIINTFEDIYQIQYVSNKYRYTYEYYTLVNGIKTLNSGYGYAALVEGYPVYDLEKLTPKTEYIVNVRGTNGNETNYFTLYSDSNTLLNITYYDYLMFPAGTVYGTTSYFSTVTGIIKTNASINFYNGFDVALYITLNFSKTNAASTTDEYFIQYQADGSPTVQVISLSNRTAFPDEAFSNYLLGRLLANTPNPANNTFTIANCDGITSITAGTVFGVTAQHNNGWTNLKGIEYFKKITSVTLQSQRITEIPIPYLNASNQSVITTLSLTGCQQLKSLVNIKYYANLTTLNLTNTNSIDLAKDKDSSNKSSMEYIAGLTKLVNFQYNNYIYYPKLDNNYIPQMLSLTKGLFNISTSNGAKSINTYTTNLSYRRYTSASTLYYVNTYFDNYQEHLDSLVYRYMIYDSANATTTASAAQFLAALRYTLGMTTADTISYNKKFAQNNDYYLPSVITLGNYEFYLSYTTAQAGVTLTADATNQRYILNIGTLDAVSFIISPKITAVKCNNEVVYSNATGKDLGNTTCYTLNEEDTSYIFDQYYIETSTDTYEKAEDVFEDMNLIAILMNTATCNSNITGTTDIEDVGEVSNKYILSQVEILAYTVFSYTGETSGTHSGYTITSIKGLEIFKNMTSLTLINTQAVDLTPIKNMKLVTFSMYISSTINIGHIGVIDLRPLEGSKDSLTTFTCFGLMPDITLLTHFSKITSITLNTAQTNNILDTQNYAYLYYWFKLYRPTVTITVPTISVTGSVVAAEILSKIELPDSNTGIASFDTDNFIITINKDSIVNGVYKVNLNSSINHSGQEYAIKYNIVETSSYIKIEDNVMEIIPFTDETPFAKIAVRVNFINSENAEVSMERTIFIEIK